MKAELIDYMGSDLTVVNAARVSFDKESKWEQFQTSDGWLDEQLSEKDERLIRFLAKNGHWTPFGHPQITIRETVPIFVARQRFKHTVGFVYNEVSRRYVDDEPKFYTPSEWRKRAKDKKQGSSEEVITHIKWLTAVDPVDVEKLRPIDQSYIDYLSICLAMYNNLLGNGVAPEQARMVLPQSMYTSYYVTGSLAAWARAYKLRSDPHAQKETQILATQWKEIIEPLFPVSWNALTRL